MTKIEKMVERALAIANDNSHGYSQQDRWDKDYDCSSLAYICANYAGYNVKTGSGYSGSIVNDFTAAGWDCVEYDGNIHDMSKGDILVRRGKGKDGSTEGHVVIVYSSTMWIEASWDYDGKTGDSSGREIHTCKPYHYGTAPYDWDYVLIPPAEGSAQSSGSGSDIKSALQQIVKDLNAVIAKI